MKDEQKVILRQLQLSGIGILVLVFGFFNHDRAYELIGVGITVFGIIRSLVIYKLTKQGKDE